MGKKNKVWLDEDRVREAFSDSRSMKEILFKLDQHLGSADYHAIKIYAKIYNLELPKFISKAPTATNTIPLEKILVEFSEYSSRQSLKKRLIKKNLLKDECYECGLKSIWNEKPLTLQLDHINGVGYDNRIENLRVLCPNCHTQTDTFGSKNTNNVKKIKKVPCIICRIETVTGRCRGCANKINRTGKFKIDWPNNEELSNMVKNFGYSKTGRVLGVTDNAVRRHLDSATQHVLD